MPLDLKARLDAVLNLEKELAFIPLGEEVREEKVSRRDAELRSMVDEYIFPAEGSLSEEDAKLLGMALLFLREAQEEAGRTLPTVPRKALCRGMKEHEPAIFLAHLRRALKLWCDVLDSVEKEKNLKHKARRFCLERVIKKLQALEMGATIDDALLQEVRLELGRALFLRAKIIRRKGFTVPLKKRKLLTEALHTLSSQAATDATRLRAWIYYELARLDDDGDWFRGMTDMGWQALREAVGRKIELSAHPEDAVLLLAVAEKDLKGYKSNLEALMTVPEVNPLDRSWAAWLLGNKNDAIIQAKMAAGRMPAAFSHEKWERLVRLIRLMAEKMPTVPGWQTLAFKTWQSCRKRERRTNHLHLRWYWSQQKELYDLAFRAAVLPEKKAEIADSLKSRPALTLSQLQDRVNTDEELKKLYEEEAIGYLDQYIKDFSGGPQELVDDIHWRNLPAPWVAVHFYLEDRKGEKGGKETGHALIYNSKKSGQIAWSERVFKQNPLWQAFWAWQEAYNHHGDKAGYDNNELEKCAVPLEVLCYTLGREMSFLFEPALFPPGQPVLFVTHDFLHRLPIHMAMKNEKNGHRLVWAETQRSTYLPAFWIWQKRQQMEGKEVKSSTNPPVVMINLSESDNARTHLADKVAEEVRSQQGKVYDPALADTLFKITDPPSVLAILGHGEAHPVNPFASCLLDTTSKIWVTVQDILASKLNIAGSKVTLATCEADLVPPLSSTVDEHLSISTALLQKNNAELLGSLWRVGPGQADALTLKMLREKDKPMLDVLAKWQWEQIDEYYQNVNVNQMEALKILYRCAPFRLLGTSHVKIKEEYNG